MNAEDIIKATGQHLLFLGVGTRTWTIGQFTSAARFAKAHGVDCFYVKCADGNSWWYGGLQGWRNIRHAILSEGVGAIPYTYSYGKALDAEIDIAASLMRDCGIVCVDMEIEWNLHVEWGHLFSTRMQSVPGMLIVSTWANPSVQGWLGVIEALAPCTDVFAPQQYNNNLARYWGEFGAHGAKWLQPTIILSQEFGPNDPVAIARAAHTQGHTALSVWHYDLAVANPHLLDAVFSVFPKRI